MTNETYTSTTTMLNHIPWPQEIVNSIEEKKFNHDLLPLRGGLYPRFRYIN